MAPVNIKIRSKNETSRLKPTTYELRAFKAAHVLGFDRHFRGIVLGVCPVSTDVYDYNRYEVQTETGYLGPTASLARTRTRVAFEVRKLHPGAIDFEIIKGWQTYCEQSHKSLCSSSRLPKILHLSVFDCRARKLVSAPPECRYIALSYVWGARSNSTPYTTSSATYERFERTIEDSISVTLELGMQYLWVDKLCIDQAHSEEKAFQIQQMDLIYAHAALTIIAAAGSDPSYGLPGVNGKRRSPQTTVSIGNQTLASTLPAARYDVECSTWNTRGWTFQEGLLSRRRLTFTDHQVLFDCNSMHCTEANKIPLDSVHTPRGQFDSLAKDSGIFKYKAPGSEPWSFNLYVEKYSERRLTYPKDRLNAFEGILHAFRRAKQPVYHFWGLPISTTDKRQTASSRFFQELLWELSRGYDKSTLLARTDVPFPTWSWLAWEGPLDTRFLWLDASKEYFSNVQVWLEQKGGGLSHLDSIQKPEMRHLHDHYTRVITVEGWTVSVVLVNMAFSSEEEVPYSTRLGFQSYHQNGYFVKLHVGSRIVYSKLQNVLPHNSLLLRSHSSRSHSFIGLLPAPLEYLEEGARKRSLLLVSTGAYYERVGVFDPVKWFEWDGRGRLENYHNGVKLEWKDCHCEKRIIRLG